MLHDKIAGERKCRGEKAYCFYFLFGKNIQRKGIHLGFFYTYGREIVHSTLLMQHIQLFHFSHLLGTL